MYVVNWKDLHWKENDLYFKDEKVTSVVPDTKHPKMYRVRCPDGTLTDMVNLTRAKDAARILALQFLDPRRAIAVRPSDRW